jgi:signal transduction histidine kinase/phage shock protein PspC (stress-responsive transcriptional regulator)
VATEAVQLRPGLAAPARILLGVASGFATRLSLDVVAVRLAMIGAAIVAPPLIIVYPLATPVAARARGGGIAKPFRGVDPSSAAGLLGLLLVELAAVLAVRHVGLTLPDQLLIAVIGAQAALMFGWRRLARADRWGWLFGTAGGRAVGVGRVRIPAGLVRIAIGAGLVLLAIYLFTRRSVPLSSLRASLDVLVPLALVVVGAATVILPPLLGVGSRLTSERRGRIRADERAKLAAHLHDSVLQTLTLIQRHGDEPTEMATLARRQERELREWLYGGVASADSGRFRDRIAALAAEIEDRYRWRIELVVVGDSDVDERVEALIAATREAMVNAARHSGAPQCDVYAECTADRLTLFVRDRGSGFDTGTVADDRLGLAQSVVERMRRAGGSASVRSSAETGTEVSLELPRQRAVA